jgi:hypothetical protein
MVDFSNVDAGRVLHNEAGSSSQQGSTDEYDYTENASADDIAKAIQQQQDEEAATMGQNMNGDGIGDTGTSEAISSEGE